VPYPFPSESCRLVLSGIIVATSPATLTRILLRVVRYAELPGDTMTAIHCPSLLTIGVLFTGLAEHADRRRVAPPSPLG
jgi:hypothetical protein